MTHCSESSQSTDSRVVYLVPSLSSYSSSQLPPKMLHHTTAPLSSSSSSGSDEDEVIATSTCIRRYPESSAAQFTVAPSTHHHRIGSQQSSTDRRGELCTSTTSLGTDRDEEDEEEQGYTATPLPTRLQLHAKPSSSKPFSKQVFASGHNSTVSKGNATSSSSSKGGQTMQATLARKRADSLKWSKYQIQPVSTTIELNLSNDELRRL